MIFFSLRWKCRSKDCKSGKILLDDWLGYNFEIDVIECATLFGWRKIRYLSRAESWMIWKIRSLNIGISEKNSD